MKKILCIILSALLVFAPASTVFAKQSGKGHQGQGQGQKTEQQSKEQNKKDQQSKEKQNVRVKEKKQSFKINGSPVIKYGRYKLPINPVIKGMGATVAFDKTTGVLTVTKNTITIVIDFKNKTVTVNGVADTKSGIFTASNSKKMTVLIGYIAKTLGCRAAVDDDDVIVTVPGLDFPTNVTVTPVGGNVVVNTLNSTNLYLTASASIIAGQAAGGKAELYIGTKLVATDSVIAATDTSVTFTTSDETPVNTELQAAVPSGGAVTVKLYNAANQSVTSVTANPTLNADYTAPALTSVTSAVYAVSGSAITINITGGSAAGDKVDVTKISLSDTTLGTTYQLSDSTGVVSSADTLRITLGAVDKAALAAYGTSTLFLNVAPGSLLSDAAGNLSLPFAAFVTVPVAVTH